MTTTERNEPPDTNTQTQISTGTRKYSNNGVIFLIYGYGPSFPLSKFFPIGFINLREIRQFLSKDFLDFTYLTKNEVIFGLKESILNYIHPLSLYVF